MKENNNGLINEEAENAEQEAAYSDEINTEEIAGAAKGFDLPDEANVDTLSVNEASEDEQEELPEASSVAAANKKTRVRPPMFLAAGVLLLTVVICMVYGTFFYRSLKNNGWEWRISVGGENPTELTYQLRFLVDNQCELMMGGTTYKGRYKTSDENGRSKVNLSFTEVGSEVFHGNCYYELTGNSMSEQYLNLTDLDGFILSPETSETADSEDAEFKKKLAKTTKENDKLCYVLPFKATNEFQPERKQIENHKTDSKLTGTWYKENKKSGYGYTFTFNEDGTFDIRYSDVTYTGCYTAENGKGTYNLVIIDGHAEEVGFDYSFIDGDLVLNVNNYTSRLKKTDDPYAFEGAIK